jgi:hypothetical protein
MRRHDWWRPAAIASELRMTQFGACSQGVHRGRGVGHVCTATHGPTSEDDATAMEGRQGARAGSKDSQLRPA